MISSLENISLEKSNITDKRLLGYLFNEGSVGIPLKKIARLQLALRTIVFRH